MPIRQWIDTLSQAQTSHTSGSNRFPCTHRFFHIDNSPFNHLNLSAKCAIKNAYGGNIMPPNNHQRPGNSFHRPSFQVASFLCNEALGLQFFQPITPKAVIDSFARVRVQEKLMAEPIDVFPS